MIGELCKRFNSSKNSSEEQQASSTSASTVALETHSPQAMPRSSPAADVPPTKSAPANGLQPNGQSPSVHLDPDTGLYVYRDAEGRKRPIVNNGHSTPGQNGFENVAFNLHSTNVWLTTLPPSSWPTQIATSKVAADSSFSALYLIRYA